MSETQSICSNSPMLDHALDHARSGLPVFPCRADKTTYPGADRDANGDKIEKTGGLYKATTDEPTIRGWWGRWPNAMIGLRMGKSSGLFAIDPDAPKESGGVDGRVELAKLERRHGPLDTLTTNTPGAGSHKFFNWRDDRYITNGEGNLKGLGINVRGEGGYVIVPPSVRADGRVYEFARSAQFIADAPEWLYNLILPKAPATELFVVSPPLAPAEDRLTISERALANVVQLKPKARNERTYLDAALNRECDALAATREGGRNAALNIASMKLGQLVGPSRLSETEVRTRLFAAATANGLVDDGKQAVLDTIKSGLTKGMQQPRVIPDRAGHDKRIGISAQLCDDERGLVAHQAADEIYVATEAIQLGNDDRSLVVFLRRLQCRCQLRPPIKGVGTFASFDLRKRLDHVEAFGFRKPCERRLLRFKPQAGLALSGS